MSVWNKKTSMENNWKNHALEVQDLKSDGLSIITGIGNYMGDYEQCIVLDDTVDNRQKHIYGLAGQYNQECIMVVNNNYDCYLEYGYANNKPQYIGKLVIIDSSEIDKYNSWTKIGNEYYTTMK